ncbi:MULTISPECIES: hypothetical protein [unclassified Streptomyces]|uniref:hypothetical protein n=1 Tax=unclassified Streptomyces TaxID=2593676 RepID=UPI001BE7033A|nr:MULTISPECIES: hypothetical protein [unclassified Streptomyces]MBT2467440.1 hypothetical protein [Streptomyces sp. ISL-66]MBT2479685.1 hypothetical protein [Streptomyces sp. ISL-94]
MEIIVLIAAIILVTGIGMHLIHLLNAQPDARIAAYHFNDALPVVGRRSRKHHWRAPEAPGQPAGTSRRAHRTDADR